MRVSWGCGVDNLVWNGEAGVMRSVSWGSRATTGNSRGSGELSWGSGVGKWRRNCVCGARDSDMRKHGWVRKTSGPGGDSMGDERMKDVASGELKVNVQEGAV